MIVSAQLDVEDHQTTTTTSNTGAQQFAGAMNTASASANGSPQGANGTGGPHPNPQPGPAPVAPRQQPPPPWSGVHPNAQKGPPPTMPSGTQWFDFGLGLTLFGIGTAETMASGAYFLGAVAGLNSASTLGGAAEAADSWKGGMVYGATGPYLMWQGLKMMTPVNNDVSQWDEKNAPNMPENPGA
jgi:hypothetical protein